MFIFLIGYTGGGYWLVFSKWIFLYKIIGLYWFMFAIGFILSLNTDSTKIKNFIKIAIMCVLVVIYGDIPNLAGGINGYLLWQKDLRKLAYIAEKTALKTEGENIYVSSELNKYSYNLVLNFEKSDCSYDVYINLMYPGLNKSKVVLTEDENLYSQVNFTEAELKELKFKNLLETPLKRHKKYINGCY